MKFNFQKSEYHKNVTAVLFPSFVDKYNIYNLRIKPKLKKTYIQDVYR